MATILSTPATVTVRPPPAPGTSPLSMLAASMAPGTWAQLSTNNIVPALGQTGGASGFIFGYTDKAVWDAQTRRLYYLGSDHNPSPATPRFVQYDDTSNTWSVLPAPSWFPTVVGTAMHGYHHTAIDVAGRRLWHRPYNNFQLKQYNLDSGAWSNLPTLSTEYSAVATGMDFAPWLGTQGWLLHHQTESGTQGSIYRYDPAANNWSRIANKTLTTGDIHNVAECAAVIQRGVFGGGGQAAVSRVDSAGTVTPNVTTAPRSYGINDSIVTHDPVTGEFLFLWGPSNWRKYNALTNTWTVMTGTAQALASPNHTPSTPAHGIVACPCPTYGVILFVKMWNASDGTVWVYKHA